MKKAYIFFIIGITLFLSLYLGIRMHNGTAVLTIQNGVYLRLPKADEDAEICRNFLMNYGWETQDNTYSREKITLPDKFDNIYSGYNRTQKEAGLDLAPYLGKSGMRYTFVIKNYPIDVGELVYANVIFIDNKAIAGDIMTTSLNGFMHSLAFRPNT